MPQSHANRYADWLFELISKRYEPKSTVFTIDRAFKEWHEVFPHATRVVSTMDRLVHRSAVVPMECESDQRMKAMARAAQKATARTAPPLKGKKAWRAVARGRE